MRFQEYFKKVIFRTASKDRTISPFGYTWDSFFLSEDRVSEDFMNERAIQIRFEREDF
jgi:antitoxin VapB